MIPSTRTSRKWRATFAASILAVAAPAAAQSAEAEAARALADLRRVIDAQEAVLARSEVEYFTLTWNASAQAISLAEHAVMRRSGAKERWLRRYDFGEVITGNTVRSLDEPDYPDALVRRLLASTRPVIDVFDGGRHLRISEVDGGQWAGTLYSGLQSEMRTGALGAVFTQSTAWHGAFFPRWNAASRGVSSRNDCWETLLYLPLDDRVWVRRVRCREGAPGLVEEFIFSSTTKANLDRIRRADPPALVAGEGETVISHCRVEAFTSVDGVEMPARVLYLAPVSRHGWARSWIHYHRVEGAARDVADGTFNPRLKPPECGDARAIVQDELTRETIELHRLDEPRVVTSPAAAIRAAEQRGPPEHGAHGQAAPQTPPWRVALIVACGLVAAVVSVAVGGWWLRRSGRGEGGPDA